MKLDGTSETMKTRVWRVLSAVTKSWSKVLFTFGNMAASFVRRQKYISAHVVICEIFTECMYETKWRLDRGMYEWVRHRLLLSLSALRDAVQESSVWEGQDLPLEQKSLIKIKCSEVIPACSSRILKCIEIIAWQLQDVSAIFCLIGKVMKVFLPPSTWWRHCCKTRASSFFLTLSRIRSSSKKKMPLQC